MFKNFVKSTFFQGFVKLMGSFMFWVFATILVIGLTAGLIAIDAFVATYLWSEIVPKMFPKLVEQGYLANTVSFETMFWACAALLVLRPANLNHIFSNKSKE